ncbi:MAG: AI-2E family transporter, partial [Chloroflexota bacterium]
APEWSPATKRAVLITCLLLLAIAIWRFSIVLSPLVLAVIIAYLLNPAVNWVTRTFRLRRGPAAVIIYLIFLVLLVLVPTLVAPIFVRQITDLDFDTQEIAAQLNEAMDYEFVIGGETITSDILVEPIVGSLDQTLSPLATWAANLAVGIAGGLIWTIFILVVAFYLLLDANRFRRWVASWIPDGYLQEFNLLINEIDLVWKSYFIGQLTLAVLVGCIIGGVTALLGIRSALLLGAIAALLELIPNWGYTVSAIFGVIFAYFQGSTYIPLPPWMFVLIIAGFYFLMWQIDTNYLIPRIIGDRLQLPPAVIIIGIIAGANVAGALGLFLAAPTIATVRVLGSYLYRRLLDLEPYVLVTEELAEKPPPDESTPAVAE